MSFGPRLRTRVRLRCDDDDDVPSGSPVWGFLRDAVIACLPVALTAGLELHIDRVKRDRRREDTEFDALLKRIEFVSDEDDDEEDDDEGGLH